MHLQTNADLHPSRNFHKPRGMLSHLDWSSLTAPEPYLMPTGLFCCPLSSACPQRHPSPTAFSCFLFPTLWLAFPCLLPVASRPQAQAFVWFHAKTNKKIVCLAHPLHSVTIIRVEKCYMSKSFYICIYSTPSNKQNIYIYVYIYKLRIRECGVLINRR